MFLLLVDDEPAVRHSWRRIVEEDGHEVREAGSVQEAMEVLTQAKVEHLSFDAAIIDYELGTTLTGVNVAEHTEGRTDLIMVTGHNPERISPIIVRPLQRFMIVLGKPVDTVRLRQILARVQKRKDPTNPGGKKR